MVCTNRGVSRPVEIQPFYCVMTFPKCNIRIIPIQSSSAALEMIIVSREWEIESQTLRMIQSPSSSHCSSCLSLRLSRPTYAHGSADRYFPSGPRDDSSLKKVNIHGSSDLDSLMIQLLTTSSRFLKALPYSSDIYLFVLWDNGCPTGKNYSKLVSAICRSHCKSQQETV